MTPAPGPGGSVRVGDVEADGPGLLGGVLERGGARAATTDQKYVAAMLRVESALAAAQARMGMIPAAAAEAIAAAGAGLDVDPATLGAEAAAGGNPAIPLVARLRAALPGDVAEHLHHGATSQDVVDTASMLVASDALAAIGDDLAAAARSAADLTRTHRHTAMIGRTLLQQAMATTFGAKSAAWLGGLDSARYRLWLVRETLPVQLGGPVGTLDGFGADGPRLVEAFAAELGLVPAPAWHTNRIPVAELAADLGTGCGVVAKIAGDLVLLAQQEVGEAREDAPGRGGSSSMAHKHNPVAAISARAAARRGPALVGHLFGCMEQEHERAAGAWHAEWLPLRDLLRTTGSAAAWLADALEHLSVDPEAFARNLPETAGRPDLDAVDAAVDHALSRHAGTEETLG